MKRVSRRNAGALLVCLTMGLFACGCAPDQHMGSAQDSDLFALSRIADQDTYVQELPSGIEFVQSASSTLADFGVEELVGNSSLVCRATFDSASDPFMVQPLSGAEAQYFTELYFTIDEILYDDNAFGEGVNQASGNLTIAQMGGYGSRVATYNDTAITPVEGQEYLLFCYSVTNGNGYNYQGTHYYVIGGKLGTWMQQGGEYASLGGSCASTLDNVRQLCAAPHSATVATTEETRAKQREEMDQAYQEGRIPEEEYVRMVEEFERVDVEFAEVLSAEESKAYEDELLDVRIPAINQGKADLLSDVAS